MDRIKSIILVMLFQFLKGFYLPNGRGEPMVQEDER